MKTNNKRRLLMDILEAIAEHSFDGHFSILKFTKNWRVQLGCQLYGGSECDVDELREWIGEMPSGPTFEEAALAAIREWLDEHD